MKLINHKTSIAIFLIAFTLGSCKKSYLEKNPSDSLETEQALNSVAGLKNALNGAYNAMRSYKSFGRDFPINGDLQADNSFVENTNSGRYLSQYNYTVTVNDGVPSEIWTNGYLVILRANRILESTLTGADVDKIKAEAYAIRALMYFKLVNIFSKPYTDDPGAWGVPLILKYDPFLYPKRNTISEVYAQIISDLNSAITNAPAYVNSVHLSKYAMEGILAKVYLYMGDNVHAKTTALDVINNGGFNLVTAAAYPAFWSNPAIRTDKLETLFEVDDDGIDNNGVDELGYIYFNGYQDIYASRQLYNLYSATDVRKAVLVAGKTKGNADAILVKKFINAQTGDRDNLKVLRLSEVYLIAAEASLPGNENDARTYLNTLMAQRDPNLIYASSGTTLLNDIVNERRKELAFEGDRLYDLNRLKLPISRINNAGAITATLDIPYSSYKRLSPIPQSETTVNKNIVNQQNSGY